MKKWLVAAVAAAVVLVLPLVLLVRVQVAEAAWARSFGPIDETPLQYRAAQNGKNADLELWSKRITPQGTKLQANIFDYLMHEIESPADRAKPNTFVRNFNAAEIDEFAQWIGDEPPVFARVIHSPDEPMPNMLVVLRLEKTMLAAALARAAAGDRAGAERLLDASWALNESLRHGPTLIEQLIAITGFRYEMGVLRKADVDAAKWIPRIRSVDVFASFARAAQMETWQKDRAVRENMYASEKYIGEMRELHASLGDDVQVKPQWLELARTPIRWFDLPSILEGNRAMISAVPTARRSEHVDRDLADVWDRGAASWTYIPDPDLEKFNWGTAFRRAMRTEMERELTEKVLLARSGKFDMTSVLDGAQWIYERSDRGGTIRLSRAVDWGNLAGANVPLRYELR